MASQVVQVHSFLQDARSIPGIVAEASDLYNRGLNVFPVLRPEEVAQLAERYPQMFTPSTKQPYILKPLFISRMHRCDWQCEEQERKSCRPCKCRNSPADFESLFTNANLAVMLGRTSGNLVCIDCDSEKAFRQILDEFSSRGLHFWAFTTSRGGNFLFRLADGEAKNLPKTKIQDVQIWGNSRYCILPPSVHPSGVVYSWLNDQDPRENLDRHEPPPLLYLDQFAWLGVQRNGHYGKPFDLYGLPAWTKHLSDRSRRILSSQIPEGQRNSELTVAVYDVAAAITAGLVGYKDAQALVHEAAAHCIPPYPIKRVGGELKSALRKKDLKRSKDYFSNKNDISGSITLAIHFLETHDWKSHGRFAQSDRAVFKVCILRARMENEIPFRASIREVTELANIQQNKTVRRALHRLVQSQILNYEGNTRSAAATFSFGKEIKFPQYPINTTCNDSGVLRKIDFPRLLPRTNLEQDVFLRLGKAAWDIWVHLVENPGASLTTISNTNQFNLSTVYKTVKRLEKWGLVTYSQAEGVYFAETLDEAALADIAAQLGSNGNSIRRKNKHTREREIRTNQQIASARKRFQAMAHDWDSSNKNSSQGG